MHNINALIKEMEREAQVTRNMLQRIPDEKLDWQPHPKSMTIKQLAAHIAELPGWVQMCLTTTELDFANNPYQPFTFSTNAELMQYFEQSLAGGREQLEKADAHQMEEIWTLRTGDKILSESTKAEMIRMTYSQVVHHRAQMGVYLRLLNVPIPGSYGPSADENKF